MRSSSACTIRSRSSDDRSSSTCIFWSGSGPREHNAGQAPSYERDDSNLSFVVFRMIPQQVVLQEAGERRQPRRRPCHVKIAANFHGRLPSVILPDGKECSTLCRNVDCSAISQSLAAETITPLQSQFACTLWASTVEACSARLGSYATTSSDAGKQARGGTSCWASVDSGSTHATQ